MATLGDVIFHVAPTADNPFAWDTPDANGKFPNFHYDELEVLNWYTFIHYAMTISFGAIFIPAMLYLILFHTSGALLPYKNLLLICSTADFFFWVMDSCAQLKVRMIDGVFVGTATGPAKHLPRWGQFLVSSLGVTLVCFTNSTLPAQSFYRYYALTRGKTCDKLKTTLILAFPFIANIFPFFLLYISLFESPKIQPGFNYGTLWFKEYPLPLLQILDTRSSWDMTFIAVAGPLIAVDYVITVYFSYKTWRQLCVYADKYSSKTKILQAQLTRFLFFQVAIQLITSVIPSSLLAASALCRFDGGISTTVSVTLTSWIPILNALLTLTAIVPYRRVVKGWLERVLTKSKVSSIAPSTGLRVN